MPTEQIVGLSIALAFFWILIGWIVVIAAVNPKSRKGISDAIAFVVVALAWPYFAWRYWEKDGGAND
jgi:hypothetical protein